MRPDSFVHLHTHSRYSFDDGVSSVEELVQAAASHGQTALALTDLNSVAGVVRFERACRRHDIRPIYGAEVDVLPFGKENYRGRTFRHVLLVENDSGFGNLVELLSIAWRRENDDTPPHLTLEEICEKRSGLILLIGGSRTELFTRLVRQDIDQVSDLLDKMVEQFGPDRLVFELGDFGLPETASRNDLLMGLAEFLSIMTVVTNDVHYVLPEDEFAWRFLRGTPIQGAIYPRRFLREEKTRCLASTEEMAGRFPAHPQLLENTAELAARLNVQLLSERRRFPVHDFERGRDADSDLWDRAFQRANQIYGGLSDKHKDRLNTELDFIRREGLADYYQLLYQISRHLEEENIARGAGQGSLLTSMVAYVLGLTEIDPLEYKLQFFGGTHRTADKAPIDRAPPIFSIALPTRSIDHVIRFLRETYGESHVTRVGRRPNSHKGKLFTQVCEWAQLPKAYIHELMSQNILDGRGRQPERLCNLLDPAASSISPKNPKFLVYLVSRLHPRPLPISTAEGRLLISGEELDRLTPRFRSDGEDVAQIEADDLLAFGMPQIHIESNALLNVLDETLGWIRREHGKEVDLSKIPLNDRETFAQIRSGQTNGVPPFQSISIKALLRKENPERLSQLVKVKQDLRPDDAPHSADEFTNIFMECLLGYQCAFLKTHFHVSYMTAILNNTLRNQRRFAMLWREAHRLGIRPHFLNINNSPFEFTQANQTIRVGMKIVHLVGIKTFEEIERVRRGGEFSDMADFCRRTDPRLVTRSVIENLIRAGAFDCFGHSRTQMLLSLPSALDLHRPRISEDDGSDLFSAMGIDAGLRPEEPDFSEIGEAPLQNLLNDERRVCGFVLTRSPLEPYREYLQRSRAMFRRDLTARYDGKIVYLAGHIDDTSREGPDVDGGEALILDFEGVEVMVPPAEVRKFSKALFNDLPVLIGGKARMRGGDPTLALKFCATLRDLALQVRHAHRALLDLTDEDRPTLKLVRSALKKYPGETEVKVFGQSAGGFASQRLLRQIESSRIFWCPPLAQELRQILPPERITIEEDGPAVATSVVRNPSASPDAPSSPLARFDDVVDNANEPDQSS